MRVSVVIPALNEAANIRSAIEHAWKAGAAQVIVADGGSTDDTPALATSLNCVLVQSSAGRATQQNAGARAADGDVFLFLHADTWLEPGAIEQIQTVLLDPQVLGGAFCQWIEAHGLRYRILERGNAARVRWFGLPYGDQGLFFRRSCFISLGGFPEVALLEDLLLMKQFRRQAWPVLLPGPLHVSARRWQKYGVVRQTVRNWGILAAHGVGVSPERLARFYRRHDDAADVSRK